VPPQHVSGQLFDCSFESELIQEGSMENCISSRTFAPLLVSAEAKTAITAGTGRSKMALAYGAVSKGLLHKEGGGL